MNIDIGRLADLDRGGGSEEVEGTEGVLHLGGDLKNVPLVLLDLNRAVADLVKIDDLLSFSLPLLLLDDDVMGVEPFDVHKGFDPVIDRIKKGDKVVRLGR